MDRVQRSRLAEPADGRVLPRMRGQVARIGSLGIGRARLEPGWRWSIDIKPTVGTEWCMVHHVQVLLTGRFGVRMDDGEEHLFEPGDMFDIPPGHDTFVVGDEPVDLLDISGTVGDFGLPAARTRTLATLLMTDVVGSTDILARVGDRAWKQLLGDHDRIVRAEMARAGGAEIDTTGDGFLAEFASAGAALDAALRICAATRAIEVTVRVGVHTGEIERVENNVRGLAVHTVARVMAAAGASEVLTTLPTTLLVGSREFAYGSRGSQQLKGLPAPIELFVVRRAVSGA